METIGKSQTALRSLLIIAALVVFAPRPGRAATKCEATCPGGGCSCSYCQCGCSGGNPYCDDGSYVGHTFQNTSVILHRFDSSTDVDLSTVTIARGADHGVV